MSRSEWRHWTKKTIALIIFSLVVNHLAASHSFLDGESYRFPLVGFLFTIIFAIVVSIIADFNFKFYKQKYFSKKVEITSIAKFATSTLGYISIIYIPINILLGVFVDGKVRLYFTLVGLLITLLICVIFIALLYAKSLYDLYKTSISDAQITIENGPKIKKISYEYIACFYSNNKIVFTVQSDGSSSVTDFTLNELEEKVNNQLFFRANRQFIIHKDAVDEIEKIENGKLRIRLKNLIQNDVFSEITISRYKRKAFIDWYK